MQKYGISRKGYPVFCFCGHKCSACSGKADGLSGRTNQRLPPGGSSRRSRVRERSLRQIKPKFKAAPVPSVTLRVPPVSLRLGHAQALTPHRGVIHSPRTGLLPPGGRLFLSPEKPMNFIYTFTAIYKSLKILIHTVFFTPSIFCALQIL